MLQTDIRLATELCCSVYIDRWVLIRWPFSGFPRVSDPSPPPFLALGLYIAHHITPRCVPRYLSNKLSKYLHHQQHNCKANKKKKKQKLKHKTAANR